ncbi:MULTISPECIES: hypothetical protein [Burkholderia cepacia complex]|uniref:hypothetical protein n=1 Tax=Burkholderia cepacia complex TaxID=87882 RepID=UPI001B90FD32|nr:MULTISPECIES: hypothetical protein [Burkholderia cepacia complex]MBR8426159.1 hypothetical protein [Burkholderia cenocepacia]MCA8050717.1 hypothetical protein [Burkholderia arboris]
MRAFLLGLAILMAQPAAWADQIGRGPQIGWQVKQPIRFVVSGILRKDGSTDVVRPVHAIFEAQTDKDAVRQFEDEIGRRFRGYTLVGVLVDPIPPVGRCENGI